MWRFVSGGERRLGLKASLAGTRESGKRAGGNASGQTLLSHGNERGSSESYKNLYALNNVRSPSPCHPAQ